MGMLNLSMTRSIKRRRQINPQKYSGAPGSALCGGLYSSYETLEIGCKSLAGRPPNGDVLDTFPSLAYARMPMRALFECRLEHIGRFDRVKVECQCGREMLLSLDAFAGLPSNTHVIDLKRRLRCE
jgi:hypothetical protein